ncbi:MAG: polysaccharide biosynthesis tyrosine autokinase [Undibacterium sp.]|nr:polysaccharide biosynthesis tyrosine autokinase [Undibacterium sp.]
MTISNNQNTFPAVTSNYRTVNKDQLQLAPPLMPLEDEVELSSIVDTFFDRRWMIFKFVLVGTLIGIIVAFSTKPVYESTMLIHVEDDKPNTSKNMLGDISSLFDVKAAAISEMEILNSRLVISRAVDNLGLYIGVQPRYFPLFGKWIAKNNVQLSEPGLFGYGGYVWGNESINVSSFYVPDAVQNKEFLVTVEAGGTFRIQQREANIDLVGKVGSELSAEIKDGKFELLIGHLHAKPGAQFTLKYIPKAQAIEAIQNSMTVAEKGKQSGIIGVTLEGNDAKLVNDTLIEIGQEYVSQNVKRKLEEAEKSLVFLDKQLPNLKQNLEQSESKYYEFRHAHGTIDLVEEAKLSLQQAVIEKAKRLELQQKREELLVGFTPSHPIIVGIDKQIQKMTSEINLSTEKIKKLPFLEEDLLRLNRDMKVNTELYAALLNSAQQLRLMKAGKVSNVRLIDAPMLPAEPARPNRSKIIGISLLVGLCLGVATAFFRKAFHHGIDNPQKIEQMLGARVVYATIPHSKTQAKLCKQIPGQSRALPILANVDPEDIAIESLRCFRTTLLFSMPDFRNNIVLISSPTRDLGKSFVTVNFAAVLAASGKRVLLIDADFREGHLHHYFEVDRRNGLSESIANVSLLKQAIRQNVQPNLDFLSTGNIPPNPSEYLLHPNFSSVLQSVSSEYDIVLIDPPPVLMVSDVLTIASHAGSVFILTRSGVTTESEINETIKRLNHAGITPQGILFNDLKLRTHQFDKYSYGNHQMLQQPESVGLLGSHSKR